MKKWLIALSLIIFIFKPALAAEKAMTKAEAMALLSKSQVVKKKEAALFNFGVGYDISKINRVKLMPIINFVNIAPKKAPPDGRTIVQLTASVDDPGGPKNISGVRADLSSIGKLPNMTLVDNGLWGDVIAGDGIYSLQTSVNPEISLGDKDIPVTAANKKGWLALAKTTIDVEKDPVVLSALAIPDKIKPGDITSLQVRVDNPGRLEDLSQIKVNLSEIGGEEIKLVNVKENLFSQNIMVPSQISPGLKKLPIIITNLAGGSASGIIQLGIE